MTTKTISRRNFIKLSGMTGTALTLGIGFSALGKDSPVLTAALAEAQNIELNAWISIDTAGTVTIINHRAEMGQGSFQAVPQIIAEELEVDLNQVKIVFAQGSQTRYGSQITGGSSTVRGSYKRLLRLAASAREMLLEAASRKWNVARTELVAENGRVIHITPGEAISYGDLVADAAKFQPP